MDTYTTQIAAGLADLGLQVDEGCVDLLAAHLRAVFEANKVISLTSIEADAAVVMHTLDSLSALSTLLRAPAGLFADLGSGAGFPGIPLSIVSGRPVDLVESVKKKAAFLTAVSAALRLKATVHAVRAEELAQARPGGYAVITARAVSALPSLVELAAPLLSPGGWLVCMKGRPDEDELARGDRVAALCGMKRVEITSTIVPGLDAARTIVVYRRTKRQGVNLPRRNGLAQRTPLA